MYHCQFCHKKFKCNSARVAHVRVHTGEKPFQCPYCLFRFNQKSNLTTHVKTHDKEKSNLLVYCCSLCNLTVDDSKFMQLHLKDHVRSGEIATATVLNPFVQPREEVEEESTKGVLIVGSKKRKKEVLEVKQVNDQKVKNGRGRRKRRNTGGPRRSRRRIQGTKKERISECGDEITDGPMRSRKSPEESKPIKNEGAGGAGWTLSGTKVSEVIKEGSQDRADDEQRVFKQSPSDIGEFEDNPSYSASDDVDIKFRPLELPEAGAMVEFYGSGAAYQVVEAESKLKLDSNESLGEAFIKSELVVYLCNRCDSAFRTTDALNQHEEESHLRELV